jgi:hypothetical protein
LPRFRCYRLSAPASCLFPLYLRRFLEADGACHDCDSPDRPCRVTAILEKKTRGVESFTVILLEEDLDA